MVEHVLAKDETGVRFSLSAPKTSMTGKESGSRNNSKSPALEFYTIRQVRVFIGKVQGLREPGPVHAPIQSKKKEETPWDYTPSGWSPL